MLSSLLDSKTIQKTGTTNTLTALYQMMDSSDIPTANLSKK